MKLPDSLLENSIFEVWFIIVFIVFFIVFWISVFLRKNASIEREKGKIPIYTDKKCGGRLGSMGTIVVSDPLIRVSVYEEFVVVSTLMRIVLDIREIEDLKIGKYGPYMMSVYHTNKKYANPFRLYSKNINKLKVVIEAQMEKQRRVDESDGGKTGE